MLNSTLHTKISILARYFFISIMCLFLVACTNKNEEELRAQFQSVVDQMNKSTPMQIDEYTVLEGLSLDEDLHIIYHYALDDEAIIFNNQIPVQVADMMHKISVPLICENEKITPILEAGAKLDFIFNAASGEELKRFNITISDCSLQ